MIEPFETEAWYAFERGVEGLPEYRLEQDRQREILWHRLSMMQNAQDSVSANWLYRQRPMTDEQMRQWQASLASDYGSMALQSLARFV